MGLAEIIGNDKRDFVYKYKGSIPMVVADDPNHTLASYISTVGGFSIFISGDNCKISGTIGILSNTGTSSDFCGMYLADVVKSVCGRSFIPLDCAGKWALLTNPSGQSLDTVYGSGPILTVVNGNGIEFARIYDSAGDVGGWPVSMAPYVAGTVSEFEISGTLE